MSVKKNVLKKFQMSEQYWGCLDKMSEVNFCPAETLDCQMIPLIVFFFLKTFILIPGFKLGPDSRERKIRDK